MTAGGFLINPEGELAFVQLSPSETLQHFRLVSDARTCLVADALGREDMFTHEIPADVFPKFEAASEILIVRIDSTGKVHDEYTVPIIHD